MILGGATYRRTTILSMSVGHDEVPSQIAVTSVRACLPNFLISVFANGLRAAGLKALEVAEQRIDLLWRCGENRAV